MTGSIGLVLLVLVIAGFVCLRAGGALVGLLFIGAALVLFVQTPMGDGLPNAAASMFSAVNDGMTSAVNGGSS